MKQARAQGVRNTKEHAPDTRRDAATAIAPARPSDDGRRRVAIAQVTPELDGGRYPIKRVLGDRVIVEADLFADGHDLVSGRLLFRHEQRHEWQEAPLEPIGNDRWRASFEVTELGRYRYTVMGLIDRFATWRRDMRKRLAANRDVTVDIRIGRRLIEEAAGGGSGKPADRLKDYVTALHSDHRSQQRQLELLLGEEIAHLMAACVHRRLATIYDKELVVVVDRSKACFGAWYEMFPRSATGASQSHGTFRDCEARLPYIADMGFDVLYLPPIHPIGETARKGKNNDPQGGPDAVGSPWAIGAGAGGHTAIHPLLGTLQDFKRLVAAAQERGIEIAMDLAFQCSPDHPYVKEHPEWFTTRPDGTIQYAENPPKQDQDIYPLNFECEDYRALWEELKSVVRFWIDQGIRIFRVDNPHTKPFPFWEWLISDVKRTYPDTIFLSEAFTRPKVMSHLAKVGFSLSYTYFAWRNTKTELTPRKIKSGIGILRGRTA